MVSARLSPGQSGTVIGRGFQPGSTATVDIDGPNGRYVSLSSRSATSVCEIMQTFATSAGDAPGRYSVLMRGVNAAGAPIAVQAEFELTSASEPLPPPVLAPPQDPPTPTASPVPVSPTLAPPGLPADAPAPLLVDQTLTITGGSQVPTQGETTEYAHVMRITNTGVVGQRGEVRAASFVMPLEHGRLLVLMQGDTLVFEVRNEYSGDTRVTNATASGGQTSTQGSTLTWIGRVAPGETLVLQTSLQQTPSTAGVLNEPLHAQSINATNTQGRRLTVPPPPRPALPPSQRVVQPSPPPVDPATGPRFFAETGFSVADDSIWMYFVRRGGVRTFGAPISRLMLLNGAWVQLFEKGMLQTFEDGRVVSVNLLEAPYLPYEALGDLTVPPVDDALILAAPDPAAPTFAVGAQEFVRENAPEQFESLATRYYATFLSTVLFRDAFWDGRGDPNLIPGFNLEIWGLPTSRPSYHVIGPEQIDPARALLRYQRGIMVHDGRTGTTTAAPLGYYLRAILAGDPAQSALAEVAAASPLWAQYDPEALNWVARPEALPETNLVLVFTREDELGEAVPIRARVRANLWLEVLEATPMYADSGEVVGMASPGEWYQALQQQSGWAQVVNEGDSSSAVWIQLDSRVRATID
jgi:hypothetical protein